MVEPRRTVLSRFLSIVERGGNALPHPATLFASLAILVVIISGIAAQFDLSATHPGTGKVIQPVSLLSIAGLHKMMTEMVSRTSPALRRSAPSSSRCSGLRWQRAAA